MRQADIILATVLLALLLIVTFAFKPRSPTTPTPRKVFEPFVGYQVYGGGGGVWAPPNGVGGSPQCTDKAIGFQEDTQDPGRHWGWENNATCAFYSIPKATNVAPGQPVAQPAQGGGRQVGMYQQCGGKGGSCATDGQCDDKAWQGSSCPAGASCNRVNEWHWQCEGGGGGGGAQPQPQAMPQNLSYEEARQQYINEYNDIKLAGVDPWEHYITKGKFPPENRQWRGAPKPEGGAGATAPGGGKQCGGKGGACATEGQCVDSPWPGVQCLQDTVCTKDNEWWWHCEKPGAVAQGQPQAGVQYRGVGQVCGGKGEDCTRVAGASCVDGPWPNFECSGEAVCRQKGEGGWYYECQDPISGGGGQAVSQPVPQPDFSLLEALYDAARNGQLDVVRDFIENKGVKPTKMLNGHTILHEAVLSGNLNLVEYIVDTLISYNIDLNIPNNDNKKPIDLARDAKHRAIVDYLSTIK